MTLTREQSRAARALLGWTQEQLEAATEAAGAKVVKKTIADFESGKRSPYARTLSDIRRVLEGAGVIFIEENGEGPGVRLRKDASAS